MSPEKHLIYFVDDEEDFRYLLAETLSDVFEVQTFANAEEVLNALHNFKPPKLIITDIRMPGLSGVQLVARLKELDIHIPIIMTSGNADVDNLADSINMGVAKFLHKPFSVKHLEMTAQEAIMESELRFLNQNLLQQKDALVEEINSLLNIYFARLAALENELSIELKKGNPNNLKTLSEMNHHEKNIRNLKTALTQLEEKKKILESEIILKKSA